jgi:hypothetical protein
MDRFHAPQAREVSSISPEQEDPLNPSLLRSLPAIVALSASNYAALSPSLSLAATVAHQAVGTATIAGTLVSQTGLPVGGATVILYQGSVEIGRTISSPDGRYSLTSEPPGDYTLDIKATGYETTRVEDVVATSGATTAVRTVVPIATTYLQQIGYVSTHPARLFSTF